MKNNINLLKIAKKYCSNSKKDKVGALLIIYNSPNYFFKCIIIVD